MRTNSKIKHDVQAQLKRDPDVDPTDIGVAVKDGVVTLTGSCLATLKNIRSNVL
jgi:osmotically-inducible protein OsmY